MGSGWRMGFFGTMEEDTTGTLSFTCKRMRVEESSQSGRPVFSKSENRCEAQPEGSSGDSRVP